MEFFNKLTEVILRIKSPIQISGLIILVAGFMIVYNNDPDAVTAQILAGSIGGSFVILTFIFQTLRDIQKSQRAFFIAFIFLLFLAYNAYAINIVFQSVIKDSPPEKNYKPTPSKQRKDDEAIQGPDSVSDERNEPISLENITPPPPSIKDHEKVNEDYFPPEELEEFEFEFAESYKVLILPFQSLEGEKKKIEEVIENRINNLREKHDLPLEVKTFFRAQPPRSKEAARKIGMDKEAHFVIYGVYFHEKDSIKVDFKASIVDKEKLIYPATEATSGKMSFIGISDIYDGEIAGNFDMLFDWTLGCLIMEKNDCFEARVVYSKHSNDPHFISYELLIAHCFYQNENENEAKRTYQRISDSQQDPRSVWASINAGNMFYERAIYDSAEIYFLRALEIMPNEVDANYNLGLTYIMQGRTKQAKDILKNVANLDPQYEKAWSDLGLLYEPTDTDSALYCYNKALIANPGYVSALSNIGGLYTKLNKLDSAKKYLHLAIGLDKKHWKAYFNWGVYLHNVGLTDSASNVFDFVNKLNPLITNPLKN